MRKLFLLLLMLLAVGLGGCLPQAQATPTVTSTATAEARPAPTVILTIPAEAAILPDSGCTVITKKPTPGPTVESIFPPVSDTEHVKGPANARVTIIEYADFQ